MPTDRSYRILNKFGHDRVFSPGDWMPVSSLLLSTLLFTKSAILQTTRYLLRCYLFCGVAFHMHGDSRGGGTSLLPSSTLCVGTPADAICPELQQCHPCHFALRHIPLLKGHSGFIFDAEFSMPRRRLVKEKTPRTRTSLQKRSSRAGRRLLNFGRASADDVMRD